MAEQAVADPIAPGSKHFTQSFQQRQVKV
jgi:hypothetical protein